MPGNPESIIKCRKIAQEYLGDKVDSAKVYENENPAIVFAVGHCHIGKRYVASKGFYYLLTHKHRFLLALAMG